MNKRRSHAQTCLIVLFLLITSGGGFAQEHFTRVQPTAPTNAISTRRPPSPGNNATWINEEWKWNNGRYTWSGGYWVRPPYRGAVWVPGRWMHSRYGWRWLPGRWVRPHQRPPYRPH